MRSADFAAVNLETAVTGGTPRPKTFHFRAPAAAFTALRDAGIDLVTMANNHVPDYGPAGWPDGVDAAAAWAPYLITIKGVRIAIVGVSQVAELGAHAHMLQGSGWLGRTFVAYGLGNFLWWERFTARPPVSWN